MHTEENRQKRTFSETLFRYGLFLVGLLIASMGVAFSAKAGLGTSPVSSVPYSVSRVNGLLSFGGWLNLMSVLQISVQVLLLRKRCHPAEIVIQTGLAFVYGYLTDFSCYLIRGLRPGNYGVQFAFMLLGCLILAIGLWVQLRGGVAMLPGEAMNRAIATVSGRRYENVKILFDIIYIAVAAVISWIGLGRLEGVREGSVIAAILVGMLIRLINRGWERLTRRQDS